MIDNLLKETIFKATRDLDLDWLVSVFADNAGVVRFDDGVRRLLQGRDAQPPLGHRPLRRGQHRAGRRDPRPDGDRPGGQADLQHRRLLRRARPTRRHETLPAGVLHPKRVLKGVVAGVRDYGNRMGIPTVNGALAVDPGFLANPLVFCGTVGVIPRGMSAKHVEPGDRIVAIGGRTGRDGIHGATFSSAELTARERDGLRRRGPDRQRDHREDGARRRPPGPRPRPLPLDHRLRRRRLQLGGRRDGGRARRRGRPRARPPQVRRALVHRDLDLRGAGTDGPGRPARARGPP